MISHRTPDSSMSALTSSSSSSSVRLPGSRVRRITGLLLLTALLAGITACNRKSAEERYSELMTKAKAAIAEEKWEAARLSLLSASELMPKDAEPYYLLGEAALHMQKVENAGEFYQTAINLNPKHREARLHLGALLVIVRDYERAEDQARKLLEANPDDADAKLLLANIEASSPRKDVAGAKKIFEEVLAKDDKSVGALAGLGGIAMQDNDYQTAEENFLKATKIEPKNASLQMVLADLYSRQGRLDDAQQVVSALLKENPKNSSLRFGFGEFLLKRGLADKATTQYEEILKIDANRHDARDRLYDIYVTRDEKDRARALTTELAKKDDKSPGLSYFRGRDLELDRKPKEALANYLQTIARMNAFAPAFRRAGLLEASTGDLKTALEHLNQAVTIDPGDVGARLALARFAMSQKNYAQATEHVTQVLKRFPRQLGANVLRADLALLQGRPEEARKVYQYLIESFPNAPLGYFKLGLLEEKENHNAAALEQYRKTLSFDTDVILPLQRFTAVYASVNGVDKTMQELQSMAEKSERNKPEYKLVIGSLLLTAGTDPKRLQQARTILSDALEGNPNLTGAYFALAAIDSAQGNRDSAIANYEKLLEKKPDHTPTLMLLAMAREQQQQYPEAVKVYQRILTTQPRFGPAANNLAWLLVDKVNGDLDEALRLAQIAKEVLPAEGSATDTLGWIHFKRGSTQVALGFLEEAAELERKASDGKQVNPEILLHLATVQAAAGDKDTAKKTVDDALARAAKDPAMTKSLQALKQQLG